MTETNVKRYDIIILGAGIVGLVLAALLKNAGFRIAILDRRAPVLTWDESRYDHRVSAITRASEKLLKECGIWDVILAERVGTFQKMTVWDATSFGGIHFDSTQLGEKTLGHIVENRLMVKALYSSLVSCEAVDFIFSAKPSEFHRENDKIFLKDENDSVYEASLLVGADGAESWVRTKADIALREWDYNHDAIVATVKTSKPHENTAWQRFLPSGPLAFLPLDSAYHCSIVWSTEPENAKRLLSLSDEAFRVELAKTFDDRLGEILEISTPFSFPLRMRHAMDYVQENIALIGDAAHTIHPLAGQGLNLGLSDAKELAATLIRAENKGKSLGNLRVLREYERARKGDNVAMISVMEGFKRLFGTNTSSVKWLRNWGLNLTDKTPFLKELLMKRAMGL